MNSNHDINTVLNDIVDNVVVNDTIRHFTDSDKTMLYERLAQWGQDENRNILKEKKLNRNLPFAFLGMGE